MTKRHFVRVLATLVLTFSLLGAAQTSQNEEQAPKIDWQKGPTTANLDGIARLTIPAGYAFADKQGAQKVLEATHNLVSGNEVGVLVPTANDRDWFVIFEFSSIGYVKDDEKDKIDADALLKSITEATEDANEERSKRGWQPFHVIGWEKSPYYD